MIPGAGSGRWGHSGGSGHVTIDAEFGKEITLETRHVMPGTLLRGATLETTDFSPGTESGREGHYEVCGHVFTGAA